MVFESPDEAMEKIYPLMITHNREDHKRALEMVEEALKSFPDHYRLIMFHGMILGDLTPDYSQEAESEFIHAMECAKDLSKEVFTSWPEEDICYHLAINSLKGKDWWKAAFFLVCSSFISGSNLGWHKLLKMKSSEAGSNEESFLKFMSKLEVYVGQKGIFQEKGA
jgi:hypothetical protein